jgi:AcrR family transcriptional regulator
VATGTRTRLDPEARRAQLVALGLEMLSTRSLDQLAIEDIAAAAGISRGLLFHYFPSKRDFHEAVVRAAAADLLAHTEPDRSLPSIDQLRSGVEAFVDYVAENRDSYVSLLRGAAGGDINLRVIFDETRSAIAARVIDRLGAETAQGSSLPYRVRLAVRGWVAFGEEVILGWLSDPEPPLDRQALVDLLDDSLLALVASAFPGFVLGAEPDTEPGGTPPSPPAG